MLSEGGTLQGILHALVLEAKTNTAATTTTGTAATTAATTSGPTDSTRGAAGGATGGATGFEEASVGSIQEGAVGDVYSGDGLLRAGDWNHHHVGGHNQIPYGGHSDGRRVQQQPEDSTMMYNGVNTSSATHRCQRQDNVQPYTTQTNTQRSSSGGAHDHSSSGGAHDHSSSGGAHDHSSSGGAHDHSSSGGAHDHSSSSGAHDHSSSSGAHDHSSSGSAHHRSSSGYSSGGMHLSQEVQQRHGADQNGTPVPTADTSTAATAATGTVGSAAVGGAATAGGATATGGATGGGATAGGATAGGATGGGGDVSEGQEDDYYFEEGDIQLDDDDRIEVLICGQSSYGRLEDLLDPSVMFAMSDPSMYMPSSARGAAQRRSSIDTLPRGAPHTAPRPCRRASSTTAGGGAASGDVLGSSGAAGQSAGGSEGSAVQFSEDARSHHKSPSSAPATDPSARQVSMVWDTSRERPWRLRQHDLSAWFNYSFNELTFKGWIQRQIDIRAKRHCRV